MFLLLYFINIFICRLSLAIGEVSRSCISSMRGSPKGAELLRDCTQREGVSFGNRISSTCTEITFYLNFPSWE